MILVSALTHANPRRLLAAFIELRLKYLEFPTTLDAAETLGISEENLSLLLEGKMIFEEEETPDIAQRLQIPEELLRLMCNGNFDVRSGQIAERLRTLYSEPKPERGQCLVYLCQNGFIAERPQDIQVFPYFGLWVMERAIYLIGEYGGSPDHRPNQSVYGVYDQNNLDHLNSALRLWGYLHRCRHEKL